LPAGPSRSGNAARRIAGSNKSQTDWLWPFNMYPRRISKTVTTECLVIGRTAAMVIGRVVASCGSSPYIEQTAAYEDLTDSQVIYQNRSGSNQTRAECAPPQSERTALMPSSPDADLQKNKKKQTIKKKQNRKKKTKKTKKKTKEKKNNNRKRKKKKKTTQR